MSPRTPVAVVIAIALVLAGTARARAEDREPWKVGVSKARQNHATQLFDQGNSFFEHHEYAKAVELYARALAEWDHPQIHFNMAVALISLDRFLDASSHVQAALKFGTDGLDNEKFIEAQNYARLLETRLVAFTVVAKQPGVRLTLDGSALPLVGDSASLTLTPGNHALVAAKDGFETTTRNLVLVAGKAATETIELEPRPRTFVLHRRFRAWIPWTIAGAGAGTALLGAGLMVIGHSSMSQFEAKLGQMFPDGAASHDDVPSSLWSLRTRAKVENGVGISLVCAGGAALATGLVMVALNQPHQVETQPAVVIGASAREVAVLLLGRF